MVASSLIPSHSIATWILKHIDLGLEAAGLENGSVAEEVVYTIVVITIAIAVGWLLRTIIVLTIKHTPLLRRFKTGRELIEQRVIGRCSHIIPPLVFLALIPFAFDSHSNTLELIIRGAVSYLLISTGIGLSSVMGFLWLRYDRYRNTKNLPLRGVLNVGRGTLWVIITIVTVSVLIDKSPAVLLTGLGAFAAALMLIFKDSILGFVAGVQISQNDMLRVGDWVIVPSTIANGIVTDVTLSVVKIRNRDTATLYSCIDIVPKLARHGRIGGQTHFKVDTHRQQFDKTSSFFLRRRGDQSRSVQSLHDRIPQRAPHDIKRSHYNDSAHAGRRLWHPFTDILLRGNHRMGEI